MTTTITVTEPLHKHLEAVRDDRELASLNLTIQSILEHPVDEVSEVPDGDMQENPKTIKAEQYTLQWLQRVRDNSEYTNYEDVLRDRSGASAREKGEEPVEWEPLDA